MTSNSEPETACSSSFVVVLPAMGLLRILKKLKQKEKEMRLLML
jgi:hypothetical protein